MTSAGVPRPHTVRARLALRCAGAPGSRSAADAPVSRPAYARWLRAGAILQASVRVSGGEGSAMAANGRSHRASGQRGFTLIELLIILTILGALLSITSPRLNGATGAAEGRVGTRVTQIFADSA